LKPWLAVALLVAAPAHADETAIDGTWKGTSICHVKPSPCHDETVVYRARQTDPDSHRIRAYKIVGDKEVYMGEIIGTYTGATTFQAQSVDHQHRTATWTFTLNGDHMSGRLTLDDGTLFRLIEVDRVK
jgi:hypothetical protein